MPEQVMFLPACFWESEDDESPREAIITVEDALVVIFSRDDSLQLRLTVYEFKAVAEFVIQEIERQDEEENEDGRPQIDAESSQAFLDRNFL